MNGFPSFTPEALLFDFDGTLFDNSAAWERAWLALFRAHEVSAPQETLLRDIRTLSDAELLARHLGLGGNAASEALGTRDRLYCERYARDVRPRAGAAALLEWAAARDCLCAIASASRAVTLQAVLQPSGLAGFFDCVLTSEDVARLKPDPEVYVVAVARLGVPADRAIAFEDSAAGVVAARAAGLPVIGIGPDAGGAVPCAGDFRDLMRTKEGPRDGCNTKRERRPKRIK